MIFVELLVVEIIQRGSGRPTVEVGSFARYALKKTCFWGINIGKDKKEKAAMLYIIDF